MNPTPSSPQTPADGAPLAAPAAAASAQPVGAPVEWTDPARQAAFGVWLAGLADAHGLDAGTVRAASADASFRRYFRVSRRDGSGDCIVMDAPPAQENCRPFVQVAQRMAQAGLYVPRVLAWDEAQGFMLLTDVGRATLLDALQNEPAERRLSRYRDAIAALVAWQTASEPGVLPEYDAALLQRELGLFPDWYLGQHKGLRLNDAQQQMLARTFDTIVAHNLSGPRVFVHRDFMPRNLMVPPPGHTPASPAQALAGLDFPDAGHGPVTYVIARLMRDAFLSWEEDFVLEVTIRYWEAARTTGLLDAEGWSEDFGAFYRAVEWMGLQRHLKVMGIFARLTLRDGKPRYLADTPRFVGYVRHTASRYRELAPLLRLVDEVEGLQAATGYAFGRV